MTGMQWLIVIIIIQIIHGLGTWKLYVKAGRQAWEAFIPVYNAVVLMKIIHRPWWWTILLFLPIINLIMFPVVWVETVRSFGKTSNLDTFLAVITLGLYILYINYTQDVTYREERSLIPKSSSGEWTSSILFAIVAATLVHTYFLQPYVIPSSSLEKSLLVGDFLIVSKFHYGARVPMSTVAAPMVHDTIPVLKKKSYLFDDNFEERKTSWLNKLQLPYLRIPGFQTIKRNDIVVFNQPADTLLDMNNFNPDRNYYKPIDKKTNLVKRCVGIPGDTLEVRDGYVYIDGTKNVLPDRAELQHFKTVTVNGNINQLIKKYNITEYAPIFSLKTEVWKDNRIQDYLEKNQVSLDIIYQDSLKTHVHGNMSQEAFNRLKFQIVNNKANINTTDKLIAGLKSDKSLKAVSPLTSNKRDYKIFPHDPNYPFNSNNFGPIYIPKKDATVELTVSNLPLYKRVITEYEDNELSVSGNQILINGKVTTNYTFKKDY